MQKVRHHSIKKLWPLVGNRFQVLLTPLTGVLFTFPSRYLFTIGRHLVFSLMQWSALIHTRFHVSGATLDTPRVTLDFDYGTITLYRLPFQVIHLSIIVSHRSPNPELINQFGLGCSPFARHYWGNRIRFLFLCLLRCFTSAGLALTSLYIQLAVFELSFKRVFPFGNLRIKAHLRLPEAYRSLSRPSSPCVAKASSCCPSFVYLQTFPFLKLGYYLYAWFLLFFRISYSKILL